MKLFKKKPEIVTYNSTKSDILKNNATKVENFDSEVQDIIRDMHVVFEEEEKKGEDIKPVGLAAPQIGVSKQIFLTHWHDQFFTFINPQIKPFGKEIRGIEGCLSFPALFLPVDRPEKVKVKYYNEKGEVKKLRANDFFSRIIQHEYDHLIGKLLSDQKAFKEALNEAGKRNESIEKILAEKYLQQT